MKIAIYARISTANHNQNLETQLIPLREFCKARGFEVFHEYTDVVSGVKESRPQLDTLLADAKRRKFDSVLVWKLDRLGRSLKHLIGLVEDFQALGIQFISLTEGMDTTTPSGKLLFNVIGAIAGFERDLIRERVKAGLVRAKESGKRLGRPRSVASGEAMQALKAQGKSVREIGQILSLSPATVSRRLNLNGGGVYA